MASEILGTLYQKYIGITSTEDGFLFLSLFCLEKHIPKNSSIDLIINDEIRPTFVYFSGEQEIYKWYTVFTYLLPHEYIKNSVLSIKNADGLEVGLWKIYDRTTDNDVLDKSPSTARSSSSSTAPLSTTAFSHPSPESINNDEVSISSTTLPLQHDTLSCVNCGVKEASLWRIFNELRYCNACGLYLKRNRTNRQFDANGEGLRKEREKKSHVCAECNTTSSCAWRNIDGNTYCNRHGLKRKRTIQQQFYEKKETSGTEYS